MAIDVGGRVIKGTASSDPGSAAAGDIYHNTTHNIFDDMADSVIGAKGYD